MNSRNLYEEKKRFNGIDVLIVVLLLLITAVVIFRSQILSLFTVTGTKENCEITFVCERISKDVYEGNIKQTGKTTLNWIDTGKSIGNMTLDSSTVAPSRIYEKQPDGSYTVKFSETEISFGGKIKTSLISNGGYYLNGTEFIAPGMTITVATELAQFNILIIDIKSV